MKEGYVLITGATSGIGYELCKVFAQNGHNLIIHGKDLKKLEKVKCLLKINSNNKIKIESISANLLNLQEIDFMVELIKSKKWVIKYLVNNAGIGSFGSTKDIDINKDMNIIDINIRALTYLTKIFLDEIIKDRGGILNVSSTAAFSPGPYMNVYYSSKTYVRYFTEALREELQGTGVKVSVLYPGATKTNFQNKAQIKKAKFTNSNLMKSDKVAKIGYKGFMRNKVVIIPGIKNKILVFFSKILPNKILCRIIKKANNG